MMMTDQLVVTLFERSLDSGTAKLTGIDQYHVLEQYTRECKKAAHLYGVELFDYRWLKRGLHHHAIDRVDLLLRLDQAHLRT